MGKKKGEGRECGDKEEEERRVEIEDVAEELGKKKWINKEKG